MQVHFGQPSDVQPVEHDGRSMTLPLIVGAIVQFALPIMAVSESNRVIDPSADPASFLGRVAGSTLPVALVLWFGFGRRRDPSGWWKILLVLAPVALLANLAVAGKTVGDRRQAIESVVQASERMIASEGRDTAALKHSGATGEAGEMERVFLEYLGIVARKRQAYEQAISEAGIATMLDPQMLSGDPGQKRARDGLRLARAATARAIADEATLPRDFRRLIDQASASRRTRDDAVAGLEAGIRQNAARTRRIRALDTEIYSTIERSLDILRDARWRPAGDSFQFDRGSDAAAYNAQFAQLQALASEQERLMAEQNRDALTRMRGAGRN